MEIYVPGRGLVDTAALSVAKAVKEYDERLEFAKNMETGQWCIFIKMPSNFEGVAINGSQYLPLIGFDEVPHPEDALKKLYKADSMRHGEKIIDDMNRRNKELHKELYERPADDASGQMAEGLEWAHRKLGMHPNPRVFVPTGVS